MSVTSGNMNQSESLSKKWEMLFIKTTFSPTYMNIKNELTSKIASAVLIVIFFSITPHLYLE